MTKYNGGLLPSISVSVEDRLTTVTDWKENVPSAIYELGGTHAHIKEDKENQCVEVFTDLGEVKRNILRKYIQREKPVGVSVSIKHETGTSPSVEDGGNTTPLTERELMVVVSALPDDWHETRKLDLSDADTEALEPFIHEYDGLMNLLEAVEQSVAHSGTEAVHVQNVSRPFDSKETSQHAAQSEQDAVEAVKQKYMRGDIETVLELEAELDEPVEAKIESEDLYQ